MSGMARTNVVKHTQCVHYHADRDIVATDSSADTFPPYPLSRGTGWSTANVFGAEMERDRVAVLVAMQNLCLLPSILGCESSVPVWRVRLVGQVGVFVRVCGGRGGGGGVRCV